MRLIGMLLALGAIGWVMLQLAGGPEAETIIPEEHKKALNKAQNVEQILQDATAKQMQEREID